MTGLAEELAGTSVRVSAVYPGNIQDVSPLDPAANPAVVVQAAVVQQAQAQLRALERSYFPRFYLQGAAYALALERALGRPVARAVFVFTEPRAEREGTDLPGAKAEIEALLAKA